MPNKAPCVCDLGCQVVFSQKTSLSPKRGHDLNRRCTWSPWMTPDLNILHSGFSGVSHSCFCASLSGVESVFPIAEMWLSCEWFLCFSVQVLVVVDWMGNCAPSNAPSKYACTNVVGDFQHCKPAMSGPQIRRFMSLHGWRYVRNRTVPVLFTKSSRVWQWIRSFFHRGVKFPQKSPSCNWSWNLVLSCFFRVAARIQFQFDKHFPCVIALQNLHFSLSLVFRTFDSGNILLHYVSQINKLGIWNVFSRLQN